MDTTNTTTTIGGLRDMLQGLQPRTIIDVKDYRNSAGEVYDIRVITLSPMDYRLMQLRSLERLAVYEAEESEQETRASLISSLTNALYGKNDKAFKDIYRDAGGFYVHRDAGTFEEVYVLRLAVLSSGGNASESKSLAAQAKRQLTTKLQLPSSKYLHALKFSDGSFSCVSKSTDQDAVEAACHALEIYPKADDARISDAILQSRANFETF